MISEANKGMEAVAEHINEMQKIFEEYGTVFDELCKVFRETYPHKQVNTDCWNRQKLHKKGPGSIVVIVQGMIAYTASVLFIP